MARMKFLCDAERCIECNGCVTACKNENEVPWGVNRRRVVTINDGEPGERSISVACMHCSDAPCWRSVRWIVSTPPTMAWCCTTRTSVSAAVTASTPVRSARRSFRKAAPSVRAARWTSAPSAPAVRRRTTQQRSSASTEQPLGRRQAAHVCRDVRHQGTALPVTAIPSRTSTANALLIVARRAWAPVGAWPTAQVCARVRASRARLRVKTSSFAPVGWRQRCQPRVGLLHG